MEEKKKSNWIKDHKKAVMAVIGVVGAGIAAGVGYAVFKKKPEYIKLPDSIKHLEKPEFKVGVLRELFCDRKAKDTLAVVSDIKLADLGVVGEQLMAIDPLIEKADACVTIEMSYCDF